MVSLACVNLTKSSVNIPIKDSIQINYGSSPNLQKEVKFDYSLFAHGMRGPKPPSAAPIIPGDVILDYIPPHPAHSNPRSNRRYLFTLLEQKEEISVENLQKEMQSKTTKLRNSSTRMYSQRAKELKMDERASLFPTWKLI